LIAQFAQLLFIFLIKPISCLLFAADSLLVLESNDNDCFKVFPFLTDSVWADWSFVSSRLALLAWGLFMTSNVIDTGNVFELFSWFLFIVGLELGRISVLCSLLRVAHIFSSLLFFFIIIVPESEYSKY
jgi:hypothetical protein